MFVGGEDGVGLHRGGLGDMLNKYARGVLAKACMVCRAPLVAMAAARRSDMGSFVGSQKIGRG